MNNVRGKFNAPRASIVCLALALTLVACSKPPLVIGFIGPMTGPTSNIGVEGYRGFSLALAEANKSGGVLGRQVESRMLDDRADPGACLDAAKRLVADGVRVIVLQTISAAAAGALPWLLEQDVLVVSRTVSDATWENRDDNFLRFTGSVITFGRSLAEFAAGKSIRTVSIIADTRNRAYCENLVAAFLENGPASAPTIWVEAGFSPDETALEALSSAPDAVLAVMSGLDAAKTAQALDRQGFGGLLLLPPWSQDQNLLAFSGKLASRIYLHSSFNPDNRSPGYLAMKDRYTAVYGEAPTMPGVFGYEIAQFLFIGFADARSADPDRVKRALLARKDFQGLQYSFSMDAEGDEEMGGLIITIRDGAYVKAP